MNLFRLTFTTVAASRVWMLWLAGMILAAASGPRFAAAGLEPALTEPARAQAAWTVVWMGLLFWLCFSTARTADRMRRGGLAEALFAGGAGTLRQSLAVTAAHLAWLGILIITAAIICILWTRPADPEEARAWVVLNLQYAVLVFLAGAVLLPAAAGLGSRCGQAWGAAAALLTGLTGLYGMEHLDSLAAEEAPGWSRTLWTLLPHFHLADLTERLVFKLGALPLPAFLHLTGYFLSMAAVAAAVSSLIYTPRRIHA